MARKRPERIKPGFTEIKKFLIESIVDPNKDEGRLAKELIKSGNAMYFETRTIEYMTEASRLRRRIIAGEKNLIQDYRRVMQQAVACISYAAGIIDEANARETPDGAGSSNPGSDS